LGCGRFDQLPSSQHAVDVSGECQFCDDQEDEQVGGGVYQEVQDCRAFVEPPAQGRQGPERDGSAGNGDVRDPLPAAKADEHVFDGAFPGQCGEQEKGEEDDSDRPNGGSAGQVEQAVEQLAMPAGEECGEQEDRHGDGVADEHGVESGAEFGEDEIGAGHRPRCQEGARIGVSRRDAEQSEFRPGRYGGRHGEPEHAER